MKETQEVVKAFLMIALMIAQEFKDGKKDEDFENIIKKLREEPFKQALTDAYNDIELVKHEVKNIDAISFIKLVADSAPELFFLYEVIRK